MTMFEAGAAKPNRYFLWFDICTLLFVLWVGLVLAGVDEWPLVIAFLAWAVVLLAVFRTSRDEFAEHCWRSATSAVFAGLLLVPIVWTFSEGLYVGFTTEHVRDVGRITPNDPTLSNEVGPDWEELTSILFTIFFARFQWTRFRGGLD